MKYMARNACIQHVGESTNPRSCVRHVYLGANGVQVCVHAQKCTCASTPVCHCNQLLNPDRELDGSNHCQPVA